MEISNDYKEKVLAALFERRGLFGGSDEEFARTMEINASVYSRLKKGERDKLLDDSSWLHLGRLLDISMRASSWKTVETDVFGQIRQEVLLCKELSCSRIFVDNCGIGKTYTAKYLAKTEKNVFYIDCTQCKKQRAFVRAIARAVGVEAKGRMDEMKDNTKYYLTILERPIVIIDEAGALDKDALGMLQEYWNYTEGACGWYMIGANALRSKIERGVGGDKEYYAELFSRFSEKFSSIVPGGHADRRAFYKKLIEDVLSENISHKAELNKLVRECLIEDNNGYISGLRRAKTLLQLRGL